MQIPIEEIQSFAIEQWLLGDLREINNENGCLPKNLSAEKSTILNDCYILQVINYKNEFLKFSRIKNLLLVNLFIKILFFLNNCK